MSQFQVQYQETIEFLYAQLPMYQRLGKSAIKKDLYNAMILSRLLGHPHQFYPCIHVAGTNGKGTVSHYIASILQAAGFKVGLYTSPHYIDFRERIKINGTLISQKDVIDFVQFTKGRWTFLKPSFFELTVAMAFAYFRRKRVDIAVIETGLGGRLDSTNIIQPILSVITNISFDHMDMLGDTLEKIAFEKAGIIKRNTPVIIGKSQPEVAHVFLDKALQLNSKLYYADRLIQMDKRQDEIDIYNSQGFGINGLNPISVNTPFNLENIITAIASVLHCPQISSRCLTGHIKSGIEEMRSTTNYLGRWQTLDHNPLCVADSGHNEDAWETTIRYLKAKYTKVHFVIGFSKEKNTIKLLSLIPKNWKLYICAANQTRSMRVPEIAKNCKNLNLNYETFDTPKNALRSAREHCPTNELVFIGGSSYLVGEILSLF